MSKPKTQQELEDMRISGAMLGAVLDLMEAKVAIGATSKDMAALAAKELKSLGGKPTFLGYQGFPDVICISISDEVQHGIPSSRAIVDGDVVNFDFGVTYNGMITDSGRTVGIGNISKDSERLLTGTKEALDTALKTIKAGIEVYEVSGAIEDVLRRYKLGIVLELVGHGVGHSLHEDPEIPNYRTRGLDYRFKENETVAIEPIATLGSGRVSFLKDGWTIISEDGSFSAQFEHTVRVTKEGCEILTLSKG